MAALPARHKGRPTPDWIRTAFYKQPTAHIPVWKGVHSGLFFSGGGGGFVLSGRGDGCLRL